MKFLILITTLQIILAASPAFAVLIWQTKAALSKTLQLLSKTKVQKIILDASTPLGGTFTWRSEKDIPIDQWFARWVKPIDDKDKLVLPSTIFVEGFVPKIDFKTAIDDETMVGAFDLATYVAENTPSVYVSTTRHVSKDSNYIWTPRNRDNAFRYDLFPPGGIDVNPTLGEHDYENQNEIAFIGGIDPKYIFGAMELDADKRQKCYHINPNYEGESPAKYPYISKKLPIIYYNEDGSKKEDSVSQSWSRLSKRSAKIINETLEAVESMAYSESPGSFCYKVTAQSISFYQPHSDDLVKTYGKINVYIQKPSAATIWNVSYKPNISQVMKNDPISSKEVFLMADISSNPRICFEGSVHKYDEDLTNENIPVSQFTSSCVKTQSSFPSKNYSLTSGTKDNSVEIQFKVARCGN